jgi:hypothetical protein
MIDQLNGHITDEQLNDICNAIVEQYRRYRRFVNTPEHTRLFAEEYNSHRRQHQLSHAIVSAFRNGSTITGFSVSCQKDGGGHTRPELKSPTLIMHIHSQGTEFRSNYLKQYYQYNSDGFSKDCLYAYILFEEKNNSLLTVTLCLPDETGKVVSKEVLLNQSRIISLVS